MTVSAVPLQENLTEIAARIVTGPIEASYNEARGLAGMGMQLSPEQQAALRVPQEMRDSNQFAQNARRAVDSRTHLISTAVRAHHRIANYVAHQATNTLTFSGTPAMRVRFGVFDVTHSTPFFRRAFIVVVPNDGPAPTSVLYGILPHLYQNPGYYEQRGARLPVSDLTILDTLGILGITLGVPGSSFERAGIVRANYIAQTMSNSRRRYALIVPVRSLMGIRLSEAELGPFVSNGQVVTDTLDELSRASGGAFTVQNIDAFGHSSGGVDLVRLTEALRHSSHPVRHAIAIDPSPPRAPSGCTGRVKLYASDFVARARQMAGGTAEFIDFPRWDREPNKAEGLAAVPAVRGARGNLQIDFTNPQHQSYLHNWAYPRYLLHLGLEATPV